MTRIRKTVPSAVALCFICFLGTVPWAALAQTPEDIEVAARIRDTIRNTRQRLADAKTDDDKQAARAQLRQLLADVFVQDMRMREKHAAEIEARLAKLRQQYREREKVKDAIIDLQLKVIEHDAAGLDFPGGLSFTPSPGRKVPPSPNEPRNRGDIRNRGDAPRIRDELPLDQFKEVHADAIEAMTALGHFVESPDGRFFVYANSNRPRGPSEIRLIDSATGRPVATTTVSFAVAALEFTDSGVVSHHPSTGTMILHFPLRNSAGGGAAFDAAITGVRNPTQEPNGAALADPGRASYDSLTAEYNALRNQYRRAQAPLSLSESEFDALFAEARKQNPQISIDEVKKQNAALWQAVERARHAFKEAENLLDAKLKLLELDLKTAMVLRDGAKSKLEHLMELRKTGAIPSSEVTEQRVALEAAEINVQRATTLIDFFRSIRPEPVRPPAVQTPAKPANE